MTIFTLKAARVGLLSVALCALTAGAYAETDTLSKAEKAKEIGASERINFSGKLRMLSQRVVATSCNYAAGVAPDTSGPAMRAAASEFDVIMDALEFGNSELGINGAEKRKKTQRRIGMLRDVWAPVSTGLSAVDGGDTADGQIEKIANESAPLLDMAKLLVSDLSAQYSDPHAMLQSYAMLVDISGRQRMLAQRMSKNVCLLSSGIASETAKAELAATASTFETSLYALSSGMSAAGISPPPNKTIEEGLKIVIANWTELKPAVDAVLAGEALDLAEREKVFLGMNTMTKNMNAVVGHYSEASKFGS